MLVFTQTFCLIILTICEASRTVLNGDGSITVTKLTGMAVWVLQDDNHKLFVFKRCMEQRHFIAGEIKEPKRIYHEVYFWVL
jgi:hypothetical protein